MPRLGLGIHEFGTDEHGRLGLHQTNKPNGTLYVGVTSSLPHRAWQHRTGAIPGFTKRHGLKILVFAEPHETIQGAIQREKVIKGWPWAWKIRLIIKENPEWTYLYDLILA